MQIIIDTAELKTWFEKRKYSICIGITNVAFVILCQPFPARLKNGTMMFQYAVCRPCGEGRILYEERPAVFFPFLLLANIARMAVGKPSWIDIPLLTMAGSLDYMTFFPSKCLNHVQELKVEDTRPFVPTYVFLICWMNLIAMLHIIKPHPRLRKEKSARVSPPSYSAVVHDRNNADDIPVAMAFSANVEVEGAD